MPIQISKTALSNRRFAGVGVQADCFIYDENNCRGGVTDDDIAIYEKRLAALRPGIVRIFLGLDEFNPTFDSSTYDWDNPRFQRQLAHLKRLDKMGSHINICMSPWTNEQMRANEMETSAVDLIEHLVHIEKIDHIGWLSLFNEPDNLYYHDSPLYERLFPNKKKGNKRPWSDYVAMHKRALDLLKQRGLSAQIKLVVVDSVWGYAMRQERMQMAVADFAGLDVSYSCHNYIVDWPGFYNESPDFASPGMAEEARVLRNIVGENKELICWEFNNAGDGFGTGWPGIGQFGEDLLGSLDNGPTVSRKIIEALINGMDGIAIWCLCDMYYNWPVEKGLMHFGLWRYRDQNWEPKPYYYYVAALMNAVRPGAMIHELKNLQEGIIGLAAHESGKWSVVLLNTDGATTVECVLLNINAYQRLRVYPGAFPTDDRLPIDNWNNEESNNTANAIDLLSNELTVLRF